MQRLPRRLFWLITGVTAVALVTLAASIALTPATGDRWMALRAVQLAVLMALARRFPVQIAPKTKVSVDTAPLYAAALLLPLPMVIALAGGTCVLAERHRHASWFQVAYNAASVMLCATAAALVFERLGDTRELASLEPGRWMIAAPLAAGSLYLTNVGLMELVIAVHIGRRSLREMWRRRIEGIPQEGSLYLLGLLVAAIGLEYPWAMLLQVMPCYVVYRSLRDGTALKLQTVIAMEKMADLVDRRDHYTYEHSRRVGALARATAHHMGLSADQVDVIEMAGRLHDVGKIGIKSTVLMKPGPLDDTEWKQMRTHPVAGAEMLKMFPEFVKGRDFVLHHHERYDGSGYPDGLVGEQIPLGARVIAVADAWDAMTSNRAYRPSQQLDWVYAELERGRGVQFDPRVLDAFLWVLAHRPELAKPATSEQQDVDTPIASAPTGTLAASA